MDSGNFTFLFIATPTMTHPDDTYLTVIGWPSKMDEASRIDALVEATGMDPHQARLACRRNTPGIMRTLEPARREHALATLHSRGVMAIAPSQREIEGCPPPQLVRRVEQFPDAAPPRFVVDTPNLSPWTFSADQVWLVVWGRLKTSAVTVREDHLPRMTAAMHPELAIGRAMSGDAAYSTKRVRLQEIIDLHVRSDEGPRLVRMIGPRTRIGIVGDDGDLSPRDGVRSIDLVEVLMPGAVIDREFHDFDPPHGLRKQARKAGRAESDKGMGYWSFYSPWVALINQAIHG